MNGDLSLAQSLGGLRIANPDENADDVNSACASPPPPAHDPLTPAAPHEQQDAFDADGLNVSSLGFDPSLYTPSPVQAPPSPGIDYRQTPPRLAHRQSMPLADYQQNDSSLPVNQTRERPYYNYSNRPQSGLYNHPNMSSGSSGPAVESSYQRVRGETAQTANPGLRRAPSQAAASAASAAMLASNPTRIPSRSQQPSQPAPGPPPAHPPRRSSRGTTTSQDNSYSLSRPPTHTTPASSFPQESSFPQSSEEWQERGAAVSTQKGVDQNGKPSTKVVKKGVRDFMFGRTLGEGSYSQVLAATDRQTSREYAIKILDKRHIIKEKKVKYVNIEKDTLNRLTEHPGIVRLYYTFQDEKSLYFVIDVAPNGELLGVLKRTSSFDEDCSRFYGAQILDAIEYMHSRGIIHRDLKPENVLLDDQMHVKITDFGTAKILDINKANNFGQVSVTNDPLDGADTDRAVSFVGTAEYVSPELLTDKNACKASDLWAFGCIVYQLLAGRPPFKAANEYLTFQKIVHLEYTFPDGFPPVARDLVKKLLVLDPAERLPISAIKAHPFFDGIEFGKGLWKQKPPKLRPYRPYARDAAMAAARATDSAVPTPISKPSIQKPSSSTSTPSNPNQPRPQPRVITELPPPTQLDIDWSPVLTKPNERVLKLGQLTVYSQPTPNSPTGKGSGSDAPLETPSKFSRFFGASTTKKRQRLVMISSGGRLIIAPSGGDKKEAKTVVDLVDRDTSWKTQQDSKGYWVWCALTRDRHYTFEDTKANTGDNGSSKRSTEEWLSFIESAKDYAENQSIPSSYSGDSRYNGMNQMGQATQLEHESETSLPHRNMLRKDPSDNESIGRKRFSKRHSKNGLTAVF